MTQNKFIFKSYFEANVNIILLYYLQKNPINICSKDYDIDKLLMNKLAYKEQIYVDIT